MPHLSAVSLLKGGIHTYVFISNLFTMIGPDHDVFSTLISPTVRSSVPLFVSSHYKFAQSLDDPRTALQSRFVVTDVAINKAGKPVHHESFAVWVTDTKLDRKHYFIIERQPSALSESSRFDCFTSFPASGTVLKSIESAFRNMRSMSAHAAFALFNSTSTGDSDRELIPLIPFQPEFDTTESSPPSTPFVDNMTSTLAMVVATLRSGSQSVKPQSLAEDTISGCPLDALRGDETIRKFKPVELSLFDVALLAKVVHDYAPIYGLFDNQCYMFASVMFDAVVKLYTLPDSAYNSNHQAPSTPSGPVPAPSPEVGAPSNANLLLVPTPDKSGRWSGVLIIDPIVKSTIVEVVMSRFKEEKELYMNGINA